ncbi:hypothetical protein NDA13_005948 [Ustilago tritici]|nr:hypothetical protein NDA13_005948 [Ustilago tritici]
MPPIRSNDHRCHASSPGSALAPADQWIHTTNASATSATGPTQADEALETLVSNQEDTNDSVPVPPTMQCDNGMQANSIKTPECVVNLPRGTSRNRFVEITVPSDQLVTLSEVSLVFNRTSLQCILVGPDLPCNSLALEILDVPQANAPTTTARYVAQSLKTYIQVHDVWICQVSYHDDPMPPADTNIYIALISTPAGDEGGLNPVQLHAIPGYVWILTNNCKLNYIG